MMGDGYDGWTMHDGMGAGGWIAMLLVVLAGAALVAAVVYLLLRGSRTRAVERRPEPPALSSAEATLDERFVRGEIDEDEYLRRGAALRSR